VNVALDATGERFAIASTAPGSGDVLTGSIGGDRRVLPGGGGGGAGKRLAFMGGDALVGMDGQGEMVTWQLTSSEPPTRRHIGLGQPVAANVSSDFQLFAGVTVGNTPYIVETTSGRDFGNIDVDVSGLSIDAVAFDRTSNTLAIAANGRILLWDRQLQSARAPVLAGVPGHASDVFFSADGRLVVAVADRGVAVWDLDAKPAFVREFEPSGVRPLDEIPNAVRGANSAAFSRDGRLLASTIFDGRLAVTVWDLKRNTEVLRFPGERVVGFSPDGRRVAAKPFVGNGPVVVANIESGKTKEVAKVPWKFKASEASAPDATNRYGFRANVGSNDAVTLSDTHRHQQPIVELPVLGQPDATSVVFDKDGKQLAVAATGGVVSIADVDPESWRTRACSLAGRPLTGAEQKNFTGSIEAPEACPQ
jgi:WD40 repeat protein